MSGAVVRVWGRNPGDVHVIAAADVQADGDSKTITLPITHPLSRWLYDLADTKTAPFLTVDDAGERWAAPLRDYVVFKDDGVAAMKSTWIPHPDWNCPELPVPA